MRRRRRYRSDRLGQGLGDLATAYWRIGERWSASFLILVIVVLGLGMVGINLGQNIATGNVFTALQESDARGFYLGLGGLMTAIVAYMVVAVAQLYLRQTFQLRWRRWLTDRYLSDWLARHVFYRMRFRDGIDNPFAHLIGRPLIRLNNQQQGKEADFRFNLVRLREEAEGITLYGAEEQERKHALDRFRVLYDNMRLLIRSNSRYVLYQLLVSQAAYELGAARSIERARCIIGFQTGMERIPSLSLLQPATAPNTTMIIRRKRWRPLLG